MFFGNNLQHLRKVNGNMTQEKLAERVGVTRQTVSKWESGEVCPDVSKLLELCDLFSCPMDDLLRTDLAARDSSLFSVPLERIQGFRYASQLVISKHPREDALTLLSRWVRRSGLNDPVFLEWGFPYLSQEQKQRFHLRGSVAAAVLPEDFEVWVPGPEIIRQETADYAVMTIQNPNTIPDNRISQAYGILLEYLNSTPGVSKHHSPEILPCFHRLYEIDGMEYADIYVHCHCTRPPDTAVDFVKHFN